MSEPLRSDSATAPGASAPADQAARIEQLLLSGLDHYFAGQYEQAINVWTRVIFLERGHSRARAYIERARSAMAERQRESEELLHRGVAAYNAGDVEGARDLLTRAVDEGATSDEALMFLQRLNRLDAAGSAHDVAANRALPAAGAARQEPIAPRRQWVMTALVAAAIFGGVALGAAPLVSWIIELRRPTATATVLAAPPVALPVVRTADLLLTRARDLYLGGHLRDALRMLDGIDVGDPVRPAADRLTAEIQRELLAVAGAGGDHGAEAAPRR